LQAVTENASQTLVIDTRTLFIASVSVLGFLCVAPAPQAGFIGRPPGFILKQMHTAVEGQRSTSPRDHRQASHGLPTKLVTLWASRVALKRALVTVMALFEARLSLADVTQGVMLQGAPPER